MLRALALALLAATPGAGALPAEAPDTIRAAAPAGPPAPLHAAGWGAGPGRSDGSSAWHPCRAWGGACSGALPWVALHVRAVGGQRWGRLARSNEASVAGERFWIESAAF